MTQFAVSIWETVTSPAPLATIPISAKMPLGAMVFAMQQAQISSADYVVVSYDEMQTEFYHVKLTSRHLTYDRAVPGSS